VLDHWWQTETGWAVAANLRGIEPMPVKAGSATVPVPGFDVHVVDECGEPVPAGAEGAIVIRLPLPPGTLLTLWNDDERYVDSYPGGYIAGDSGYLDEDGYLFVMGRTDDVINVAGHRLSTGAMEEVLAVHPAVAECAVIGVPDSLKGQVPRGLVVLKAGMRIEEYMLRDELVAAVRREIGSVAAFRDVAVVEALPKTRRARSCAARCGASPPGTTRRCRRQSTTLRRWTPWPPSCGRHPEPERGGRP
jgi:propionyl-CoA synthetase